MSYKRENYGQAILLHQGLYLLEDYQNNPGYELRPLTNMEKPAPPQPKK